MGEKKSTPKDRKAKANIKKSKVPVWGPTQRKGGSGYCPEGGEGRSVARSKDTQKQTKKRPSTFTRKRGVSHSRQNLVGLGSEKGKKNWQQEQKSMDKRVKIAKKKKSGGKYPTIKPREKTGQAGKGSL